MVFCKIRKFQNETSLPRVRYRIRRKNLEKAFLKLKRLEKALNKDIKEDENVEDTEKSRQRVVKANINIKSKGITIGFNLL